ncbi:ABC transporter ATP-binding protein [Dongia soli]|uniref:ABC transporter ATP-binding protein n=1 Tax=Dongia soli TaxID=600628 RepID=A0ABU5EAZ1_9PROT|nr:ABC transporter ATP-binding protein [Dongia soli]MDY0883026.1 ABC transporter ATP-binding protein [Dongia soli]
MNGGRQAVLELRGVKQSFKQAAGRLDVIATADLQVYPGEMVALIGPSGSGKSTLLHITGLLEHALGGDVIISGQSTSEMSDRERTRLRRTKMGFVYQYHHLLPEFSALENVVLPQMIAGRSRRAAKPRAVELLTRVGLGQRLDHRPAKLSGGEQQRVAIARALANQPSILLADEPTGNLDIHTADDVFALLLSLVRDTGVAAMIATHNLEIAKKMDRVVTIREGVLEPY